MPRYDHVIVGSGINSLVCGALLAKRGRSVCVLERNDRLGGCMRTEELTRPGFLHDTLSTAHPLFVTSPGYAELKDDLHAAGLEYVNNESPTGVLLPDGRSLVLSTDQEQNVTRLQAIAHGDGDRYREDMAFVGQHAELIFGLLGSRLYSWGTGKLLWQQFRKLGVDGMVNFKAEALASTRSWLEHGYQADLTRALLAPWILHVGLGPESALSALMNRVVAFTLEQVGMPMAKGGNARIVAAFESVIRQHGGELFVDQDVDAIDTRAGRASGVRAASGETFEAMRSVICNVTPTQLYGRLLRSQPIPDAVRRQAADYRYGRGDMQIHLALDAPPDWPDESLKQVVLGHLSGGLDSLSRAVNQAERGLLPDEPTIVVAQPTALDPGRAPDGKWILWIQLQEIPRQIRGDTRGEIDVPDDGSWTETVRERYADRVIGELARYLPNVRDKILDRHVLSPADLERLNINLVGGDPYSGDCSLDQFFALRPLRGTRDHRTPVSHLYHIGASTHPGPGLGGVSGYLVADLLS
jgi:phytoene dehydrogenase-like protein